MLNEQNRRGLTLNVGKPNLVGYNKNTNWYEVSAIMDEVENFFEVQTNLGLGKDVMLTGTVKKGFNYTVKYSKNPKIKRVARAGISKEAMADNKWFGIASVVKFPITEPLDRVFWSPIQIEFMEFLDDLMEKNLSIIVGKTITGKSFIKKIYLGKHTSSKILPVILNAYGEYELARIRATRNIFEVWGFMDLFKRD